MQTQQTTTTETNPVEIVAGMLATMRFHVELLAGSRAMAIAGGASEDLLEAHEAALEDAKQWLNPAEVDAMVAEAEQTLLADVMDMGFISAA